MPDLVGAVFPGAITFLLLLLGRTRSCLRAKETVMVVVVAAFVTALLSRWHVDAEQSSLHLVPGATSILLYLLWRGRQISPGYAFAVTYLSTFPVDLLYATNFTGSVKAALPGIGGAGIHDGLLVIPALTSLGVWYGGQRISRTRQRA